MIQKLIVITLFCFLFHGTGKCSEEVLPAKLAAKNDCANCQCLTDIGNFVFAGASVIQTEPSIFQSQNCQSQNLPSPGNLMVASIIRGALTNAGPGGSLDSCHDQWGILVERLSRRKYQKDCSANDSSNELLTRCDEDAYILSMFSEYHNQKSAGGIQLLSEVQSDCKDVAPVFSIINVLIRFENTAFLNSLVMSGELEDLILEDDEAIGKALYLLTQHSENFPQVQTSILDIRMSLLEENIGPAQDVAALADRIQIMKDKTQLYGTHTSCELNRAVLSNPVDDIGTANLRRADIGLQSIQEFLTRASNSCIQDP